jgi:hypothetical protein
VLVRPAYDVVLRVRRGHVRAGVDPIVLGPRRSSADTELLIGPGLRQEKYEVDGNRIGVVRTGLVDRAAPALLGPPIGDGQEEPSGHATSKTVWTLKKPKLCGLKGSTLMTPRLSPP